METNQLVKDRLGLLAVIKQNPDIKEMLFNALSETLETYENKQSPKAENGIIDNKYVFKLIDEFYSDWYGDRADAEKIRRKLEDRDLFRGYITYLVRNYGLEQYNSTAFGNKFMEYVDLIRKNQEPVLNSNKKMFVEEELIEDNGDDITTTTTTTTTENEEELELESTIEPERELEESGASEESEEDLEIAEPITAEIEAEREAGQGDVQEAVQEAELGTEESLIDEAEWEDFEEDEDDELNTDGYEAEIELRVTTLMQQMEAILKSCFELEKVRGVLLPVGNLQLKLMRKQENGKVRTRLEPTLLQGNMFNDIYNAIVSNITGTEIKIPRNYKLEPNADNIEEYNYFPLFMYKYAIGNIGTERITEWNIFADRLKEELTEKLKNYAEKGLLENYASEIERAYGTCFLILKYKPTEGMKFRVSVPSGEFDDNGLEASIKSVAGLTNSTVIITHNSNIKSVVDIQIIINRKAFYSEPTWAYKALSVALQGGQTPSLLKGLPIGAKISGAVTTYRLTPSSGFLTYLAAGSGAGKGVMTLSLLASAIGSGIPIFYVDCKPDMAKLFWDLANKYGIQTFAYDGGSEENPLTGRVYADLIPEEVRGTFGESAGILHYLKCLEWVLILARGRASGVLKDKKEVYCVFDECEAVQEQLCALGSKLKGALSTQSRKDSPEVYKYASDVRDWLINLSSELGYYIKTSGRVSNVFTLFIAQDTNATKWKNIPLDKGSIPMLAQILKASTVHKILGKGCSGTYGLDGGKLSANELSLIEENRFFTQFDGAQATPNSIEVFKPFLTLNTDDPNAGCWRNGIGRDYMPKDGNDVEYYANLAKKFKGKAPFINEYGMHTGTGFEGLSLMYCQGDTDKLVATLQESITMSDNILQELGGVYPNIDEFVFDLKNYQVAVEVLRGESIASEEEETGFYLSDDDEDIDFDGIDIAIEDIPEVVDDNTDNGEFGDSLGLGDVEENLDNENDYGEDEVIDLSEDMGWDNLNLVDNTGADMEVDAHSLLEDFNIPDNTLELPNIGEEVKDSLGSLSVNDLGNEDVAVEVESEIDKDNNNNNTETNTNTNTNDNTDTSTASLGLGLDLETAIDENTSSEDIARLTAECMEQLNKAMAEVSRLTARMTELSKLSGKKLMG